MNNRITFLFLVLLTFTLSWQGSAQSGSTCEDPLVVSSLPFNDSDNTSTFGNNYTSSDVPATAPGAITNGTGSSSYLGGDDAVYAFESYGDGTIDINATFPSSGWFGLWVFKGCPFDSTVGYHTGTSGTARSIPALPVEMGETYYIIVSSWANDPQSTDYTLNITGDITIPEDCTGTPDADPIAGPDSACGGISFTLVASNNPYNGIEYQWQRSTDGGITWTDIAGATSSSYAASIMEDTDFRYEVTCTASGLDVTSDSHNVSLNDPMECYCIPTGASNNADEIRNFTLGNLDNDSAPSEGTNGYSDYTETVPPADLTFIPYTASLTSGSGSGSHGAAIWIDYNDNGIFEASEKVAWIASNISASSTVDFPEFVVGAYPGLHRLRVQYHYNKSGEILDPCVITSQFSETEDYMVNIAELLSCTGMPEAGTAVVDPVSGNPGTTYNVTASGFDFASDLSFQWQSNTNNAGWVDEGTVGDTYTPYTATASTEIGDVVEWRLAVTCTVSEETAYSEVATFTTSLVYCTATNGTVEAITRVVFAGIDNPSSASSSDAYEDFTAIVAEVEGGETYSFAAEGNTAGNFTNYFTVWIDWNQNGEFEAAEMYEIGSIVNSDGTDGQQATSDIVVPAEAMPGETRMRVVKNFNSSRTNPCGSTSYGQVEDYTVNVGGGGETFPSPYCDIEDAEDVWVEEITKVELAGTTITNDNSTDVLIDKTSVIVNVTASDTYNLSVEGNTYGNFDTNIVAFIDWNQNGILDDAGEVFEMGLLTNSTGNDGISVNMDIPVPADAVLGETRIRITKTYTDPVSTAIVTPCGIQFDPFGMGIEAGYGQALDFTLNIEEGSAGGEDCDQGDDSNIFENGFNITAGSDFRNADDFMVSANNTLNIQSIELNVMSMTQIPSLDINFYNDDNGAPGSTLVESVTGLVPYAQTVIGEAFGYPVYSVLVEVDLEFEGGATGTTYWMQPVSNGGTTFWEVSTAGTLGEPIHTSEAGGAWVADVDGADGVFKLYCDVAPPPPFECMFNISFTVEPITRVQMANVDNPSSASSTEALEDFTAITIQSAPGATIDVALEGNTAGAYTNYFTVFINTGGEEAWSSFEMFEIGSITGSTGTDGQQATATITLPGSLTEGEYLLRVVKNYNVSPTDPCASYSFGQAEDYTLVLGELEDCSGTPDGGVAVVNPDSGNINTPYTVSATGYSTGNGLTYQWQSNTDGAGWVDEGDLQDHYSSYAAIAPDQNGVSVDWRLEVTCTISSESSYSEVATFTTGIFYCVPVLDCTDNDMITNVTFQEIDNTTTCSPNGYGDYTAMVATVQSGGTYPISVSVGDGWAVESVSVWIDFDNSGSFDEDEFFFIGTGSGQALPGDISIPAGVADGDYRMRVRVVADGEAGATWDMACDEDQVYGETEDYTVTVDGVVGVEDYSNLNFSFYPNPMSEVLYITANQNIESVSAYNVLGQQVISNNQFADGKVDVSSLPTGTFIFRVTFEGGLEENFKVIKE